jgi:hypothetical protein
MPHEKREVFEESRENKTVLQDTNNYRDVDRI